MLEQVEQKIQELKKLQAEEYYKKKDEDLNAWGLTTKRNGKKTTPIIVTDDEYEALIKASNGVSKSERNSVANMLKTVAVTILVIGAAAGSAVWAMSDSMGFVWFSVTLIGAAVIALLFYGISEAISLLQQLIDMNPRQKPDPVHARTPQNNMPLQPPVTTPVAQQPVPSQYPSAQPPIYQAAAYRQTAAQPVNGAPAVPVHPVAQTAAVQTPDYGAPQNYNETGPFENEVQDDFFSGSYNAEPDFVDYENGI